MNEKEYPSPVQWLRILFYIELVNLGLGLLGFLPIESAWLDWPRRILMAGSVYCMFKLTASGRRYLQAAIFRAVQLVCGVTVGIMSAVLIRHWVSAGIAQTSTLYSIFSGGLSTAAMLASWIATYQLYNAHGDLVEEKDPALAKKWRNLFYICLVVSVLVSLLSAVMTALQLVTQLPAPVSSAIFTALLLTSDILALVAAVYLYRTVQTIENGDE